MTIDTLQELFLKRGSHRRYGSEAVPVKDIEKMIDTARFAPSAHNTQPWRFLAITRKDLITKIAAVSLSEYQKLVQEIPAEDAELFKKFEFFVDHFKDAPLVIAVVSKKADFDVETELARFGIVPPKPLCFDLDNLGVGAVIENLLLSAEVMGYGTCWIAAPVMYAQAKVEELLGLEEPWHFVSLISVTRPVRDRKSAPKKSLDDILTILS